MEYFDLTHYLLSKKIKSYELTVIDLEFYFEKKKKEIFDMAVREAITKVKMMASIYPMLEIVSSHKTIEIVAYTVNKKRVYGKSLARVNSSIIANSYDIPPDNDHYILMNYLKRQIKSHWVESRKARGVEDAKQHWINIMSKSKKATRKEYPGKIDFKKINTFLQSDDRIYKEYKTLLSNILETEYIIKRLYIQKEDRIKRMKEKFKSQLREGTCPICLDDDELLPIKCGHLFHAECLTELFSGMLDNWDLAAIVRCPMCRHILN